ncbi:MAG: CRISPR-associated endonuclease Cas2 [Spirulinaceae cyanobacterium SM2_1_0]|nr:CRISPR-associated endonuclease Cas2 [Spirulinaceae cyanobacterium SM2_1_0]
MTQAQLEALRAKLLDIIHREQDNLRIYRLRSLARKT